MEFLMEMLKIVWPILFAGAIGLFVILRLKNKFKRIAPEEITSTHTFGSYFIPFGMMFGVCFSVIFSMFSSIPLLTTVSVGASIGYLFGYFAYEVYSRKGESTH